MLAATFVINTLSKKHLITIKIVRIEATDTIDLIIHVSKKSTISWRL